MSIFTTLHGIIINCPNCTWTFQHKASEKENGIITISLATTFFLNKTQQGCWQIFFFLIIKKWFGKDWRPSPHPVCSSNKQLVIKTQTTATLLFPVLVEKVKFYPVGFGGLQSRRTALLYNLLFIKSEAEVLLSCGTCSFITPRWSLQ